MNVGEELADYREWTENALSDHLETLLSGITLPSEASGRRRTFAGAKWPSRWEVSVFWRMTLRIAALTGSARVSLEKKGLLIFCGDNGVVAEGVSQTGQEVTAIVTANFTKGESCSCLMAERAGADVFPVDLGVACETDGLGERYPLIDRKIRRGTSNFTKESAMTRRETLAAVLTGIDLVRVMKENGYRILATGEMGIGNTTTSSAVASVILSKEPQTVTGKGAGLSKEGLVRKVDAIRRGIELLQPNSKDGIDILSKVGGFDLAGMAGAFLGGAIYHIPIVIDGFISAAAAAAAAVIDERAKNAMLAAHVSAEPAAEMLLSFLGVKPAIRAELCLGEGTGALALFPLLDMTLDVYERMCTFSEIEIEDYKPL